MKLPLVALVVLTLCAAAQPPVPVAEPPQPDGTITLHLRSRLETFKGSGQWDEVRLTREVPAREVAVIVCDMWDKHWCEGASRRADEMASRMNPILQAARARGLRIVHAPSETMKFYADTPQRQRMQTSSPVEVPKALELTDPPLPIDDSDGGCDTPEKPWYRAWSRQNAKIEIGPFDGISDDGREVYAFLKKSGVKYLVVMGVHANMCVLNRSFAIKQMTRWGLHCILCRDLTDTMYDPKDRPYVSHEQGTELVVQHIEKYWAPSILSSDLQ